MCGIAGIIDFHEQPSRELLMRMLSKISYRGPDSEGIHIGANVALGIRRLRIIDLITGDQPIYNEDKTVVVVFNGEIYNYQKLRDQLEKAGHRFSTKSDTEVLVHAYESYGTDFLPLLNGMFTFALWDSKKKVLLLVRDHAGIKPLYVFQKGSLLIYGSELKTILLHPQVRKQISISALRSYSNFGYVKGADSIFQDIKKVPAGSFIVFSKTGIATTTFWQIKPQMNSNLDLQIARSVSMQKIADVPVGLLLSGGIDSSLLAYYFQKEISRNLRSFSISFSEQSYDESCFAQAVAKHFGFQHDAMTMRSQDIIDDFPKITELLDEPIADPSLFPTFKVAELARKYVKVALSGDGGDELFGGYPTYQAYLWNKFFFRFVPTSVLLIMQKLVAKLSYSESNYSFLETADLFLKGVTYPPIQSHIYWMCELSGEVKDLLLPQYKTPKNLQILKLLPDLKLDDLNRLMMIDYTTYLRDNLLVKTDRASMYNSLEIRVPFLDPTLINTAFGISGNKKVNIWQTKQTLRNLGVGKLPEYILKRKKKGFGIPLTAWVNGGLKPLVNEMLHNKKLYEFYDKNKILKIWELQLQEKTNYSKAVWKLVMFSAWLQKYYAQ